MSDIEKQMGDMEKLTPETKKIISEGLKQILEEELNIEDYRSILDLSCGKRMALTKVGLERGPALSQQLLWNQVLKVQETAKEMNLEWSLMNITLQITDNRYLRALNSEFTTKGEEEK